MNVHKHYISMGWYTSQPINPHYYYRLQTI